MQAENSDLSGKLAVPLYTGCKMDVHETFGTSSEHLM